jgi:O-antigen ligase
MDVSKPATKDKLSKLEALVFYSLFVFLAGFYLLPPGKLHNNIFYAGVALPGLFLIWHCRQQIRLNIPLLSLLVFLIYSALSSSWSITEKQDPGTALKYSLYTALLFIVIGLALQKQQLGKILIKIIYFSATLSAIINSIIWYSDHPLNSRLYGNIGINECIGLGVSYGLAAVLAFYNMLTEKTKAHILAASAAFLVLLAAVLLTQSRLAFGCTIAALVILCILVKNKRVLLFATLAAATIAITFLFYPELFSRHSKLIDQALNTQNAPRFFIWKSLIGNMTDNWIFGHGLDSPLNNYVPELGREFVTAHSVYIGHLFLTGIIGLTLLINLILQSLLGSIYQAKEHKYYLPLALTGFGSLCMVGQYTHLLDHPNEIWINILIPFALVLSSDIAKPATLKN